MRGGQVMSGYWRDEGATSDVLTADGWLRTGDLGEIDDEGFVRVTGRAKEMLVTAGGKNVAPAPLEDRIRAHELVSQCLVVGDSRPYIAALITLDADAVVVWARAARQARRSGEADPRSGPARRAADGRRRRELARCRRRRRCAGSRSCPATGPRRAGT